MTSFYIDDFIQIDIDDSYKWISTLFFNNGLAICGTNEKCKGKILLKRVSSIEKSDVRSIGDGAYIGDRLYIDEKYGVRFERIDSDTISLTVIQECNEWLVISIELLLLQQNKTMIHAAAVEKNGKALLLPSWGGVGKTAIVCKMIKEHGWKLLGDDLVIIGDNHVYPFLKPFVIYPYHKNLFPELFRAKENHTVKNQAISKLMSKSIPTVKRLLRPMPFLLAFLRKHNPQSMRVSPRKIFSPEQLSEGAVSDKIVWLERSVGNKIEHKEISLQELVSKAISVSSVELYAEKLNSLFHMCGCGIFNHDETIGKMTEIVTEFSKDADISTLKIPVDVSIDRVGDIAFEQLIKND
ncbi:MAG: hypothetical protein PUB43_06440 [Oscillospiraceae bacterium]|nr:hypothetical protein [Oscillospiraceae bacterium]